MNKGSSSLAVLVAWYAFGCGAQVDGGDADGELHTDTIGSVAQAVVSTTLTNAYDGNALVNGEEGDACTVPRNIYLAEPDGAGPYPVLIYTAGTWENYAASPVAQAILTYAASQGFVAAFVEYRNDTIPRFCSDINPLVPADGWKKARCLYSTSYNARSAVAALCARPKAGCSSKGIVTAGFSQGGYLAAFARNYDARVRGAWTMGIVDRTWDNVDQPCLDFGFGFPGTNGVRLLPNDRLRVIRGVNDWTGFIWTGQAQQAQLLNRTTGRFCAYTQNCLNGPGGSGWYLVPGNVPGTASDEVNEAVNPAAHCFQSNQPLDQFGNKVDCVDLSFNPTPGPATVDPKFAAVPPAVTFPGGMYQNIQWLKGLVP